MNISFLSISLKIFVRKRNQMMSFIVRTNGFSKDMDLKRGKISI
jgi:hypothetical protein